MSQQFVVYVDFDSTLYDTPRFSADLYQMIAKAAELPPGRVVAEATRFRGHAKLGGYDYAAHVSSYGLDPESMWPRLEEIARTKDYLYPDAVAFIHALHGDGLTPRILSFGERRVQAAKIKATLGRLSPVPGGRPLAYTIIFEPKNGHIAALHPGERGVLVDDIPDQQLPAGFHEIHLDRRRGNDAPLARHGDNFAVANLLQAGEAIHQLIVETPARAN